jgi:NAD(P)-dependent dehydrogenase (short-subunit alcohol dehydrogenase family)
MEAGAFSGGMKIVISGVTTGLGRALAEAFLKAGHAVAGCGDGAAEIMELRFGHAGGGHVFDVVDTREASRVALWAEKVTGAFRGAPDVVVAFAGAEGVRGRFWETDAGDFSRVMDVNAKGVANVLRAFLPGMAVAGRGKVVAVGGAGRRGEALTAACRAARGATEGLMEALAGELPAGMRAVALQVGETGREAEWAARAARFIIGLGPEADGKIVTEV